MYSSDPYLHRTHDNLPREQREALKSLRLRKDIIIKPADKGSGVVVMDRQLTNHTNYETLDSDPTGKFCKEIHETLDDMRDNNHLSETAHKFLSHTDCRTVRL